jgi:hypothetical protein
MSQTGHQNIQCSVSSCKYNEGAKECSLKSIKVAPDAASPHVASADQSMCSSFEHLQGR